MSEKNLKRTAHHPKGSDDTWWYEENDGIYIVMESDNANGGIVTNTCKIKWASLRAALKRKDKK